MDPRSTTGAVRRRAPRSLPTALAGLLAASALLAAPSAVAKDDVSKNVNPCKETSSVKLKAEADSPGIIKVTGVVFSQDDDTWEWKMRHNDDTSAKGTVKAKDADRSFKIIRDMADFSGTDDISFRAENLATGEVCSVSVPY
jgi:hypothetical protein